MHTSEHTHILICRAWAVHCGLFYSELFLSCSLQNFLPSPFPPSSQFSSSLLSSFPLLFSSHFLSTRLQSEWWTDKPDCAVRIRYKESGEGAEPAETILDMFERIVTGYGEHTALAVKRLGEWKKWTYKKYQEESMIAAKAMIEVRKTPNCFGGRV